MYKTFIIILKVLLFSNSIIGSTINSKHSEITETQEKVYQFLNAHAQDGDLAAILLPNIPDPFLIPDIGFQIESGDAIGKYVHGTISLCNSSIIGISKIDGCFSLELPTLTVSIKTGPVSFEGLVDLDLNIYEGDYLATSSGNFKIGIVNVSILLMFDISINILQSRLSVENLGLDMKFQEIVLIAEGLVVNDLPYNITTLSDHLKPTFDKAWPIGKALVGRNVQNFINDRLKGCTLVDILDKQYNCFLPENTNSIKDFLKSEGVSIFSTKNRRVCSAKDVPVPTTENTEKSNGISAKEFKNIFLIVIMSVFFF